MDVASLRLLKLIRIMGHEATGIINIQYSIEIVNLSLQAKQKFMFRLPTDFPIETGIIIAATAMKRDIC